MKYSLFTLALILPLCIVFSQKNAHQLVLQPSNEGTHLRWFPADFDTWLLGLSKGYNLERSTDGRQFSRLNTAPIIPAFQGEHEASRLAQQTLIYQDSFALIKSEADGERLLEGLYREYRRKIAAVQGGISQSGLYYKDQSAVANRKYTYRIRLAGGEVLASATVGSGTGITQLPSLEVKDPEYSVILRWNQTCSMSGFQTFSVERSENGETFSSLTPRWHFPRAYPKALNIQQDTFVVLDSIATLNKRYYYRLVGVDAFGQRVEGKVISMISKDRTAPKAPVLLEALPNPEAASVTLNWSKEEQEADFGGFLLYRSRDPENGFVQINERLLPPNTKTYTDKLHKPEGSYYYKVVAVDEAGNAGESFRRSVVFTDKTPPSIPAGLIAERDTLGQVTISWQSNKEDDLAGYQLARARFKTDEFVPLTQNAISATFYHDTLALHFENREIYYQLAAVDRSGNVSSYSPPFELLLPDTIAPVVPILNQPDEHKGSLYFSWQIGTEKDLSFCELFTRKTETAPWQTVAKIASQQAFQLGGVDTLSGNWQYVVQAVDKEGNRSPLSNIRTVRLDAESILAPVQHLSRSEEEMIGGISLNWVYPLTKSSIRFLVFRQAQSEASPRLLAQVNRTGYRDEQIESGQQYTYFIIAQDDDGTFAMPSNTIEASIK